MYSFAKINVAIKHDAQKLKMEIELSVLETGMQNKHHQKRKIKKQICDIKFQLKASLTVIFYNSLLHRINVAVKSRAKATMTRHLNKLRNLRKKRSTYSKNVSHTFFIKNTLFKMSSCTLIEDEDKALAFRLDHHIEARTNKNVIDTEFELYLQLISHYVNEVPDHKNSLLKTKLSNMCERYLHLCTV